MSGPAAQRWSLKSYVQISPSILCLPWPESRVPKAARCHWPVFLGAWLALFPKFCLVWPAVLWGKLRKCGHSLAFSCQGFGFSRETWPCTQNLAYIPLWCGVLDLLFGV